MVSSLKHLMGKRVVNNVVSKYSTTVIPDDKVYSQKNVEDILAMYADKVTQVSLGHNSQVNVKEFMKENNL